MATSKAESKPGVEQSITDDTFPVCGDTRRIEIIPLPGTGAVIVNISNPDTPGDGKISEFVYEEDLPNSSLSKDCN